MIAAKVAQRARARLAARPARGDRRRRRLRPTRTAERARAAGADVVLELPRGGKVRAQDAAVGARPRRARGVLRRQRALGARRAARSSSRRSPTRGSATSAARSRFVNARRRPTRRACTGATRCGCARCESRLASVTGGNGAIYATRTRRLHRRRPDHGPRPLVPVQHGQARLARRLRARRRARREKMVPIDRGRVRAQAADDEPRLADRRARRPARPARLRAAVRADDRLAPAAALRDAVPAPARARRQRSRCSTTGAVYA